MIESTVIHHSPRLIVVINSWKRRVSERDAVSRVSEYLPTFRSLLLYFDNIGKQTRSQHSSKLINRTRRITIRRVVGIQTSPLKPLITLYVFRPISLTFNVRHHPRRPDKHVDFLTAALTRLLGGDRRRLDSFGCWHLLCVSDFGRHHWLT